MKTAMHEMIERVEKMVSIRNFQQWEDLKIKMIELEKQQMLKTAKEMHENFIRQYPKYLTFKDYYHKLYNP